MNSQGIKVKKQMINILILLLLAAFTVSFYLKGYSLQEFLQTLKNTNYWYLICGLGLMFLFVICEAINIYLILNVLGQSVSMHRCLEYSCIGFYFSSITPSASGGQPAQIYYMKKDKILVSISTITIFFVVFVYQIAMIILGVTLAVFRHSEALNFIHKLKYLLVFGGIVNVGAIFLFLFLMFSSKLLPNILNILIKIGFKLKIVKRMDEIKTKAAESMAFYKEKAIVLKQHPVLFFKVFFVTIIQMIALNLIPYIVYKSMHYNSKNLLDLLTCQSLLTISVSAVPLPGAEGITQSGFLHVFDMYIPKNTIATAMLINRMISFYIPLLLSLAVYIYTHIRSVKQSDRGDLIEGEQN